LYETKYIAIFRWRAIALSMRSETLSPPVSSREIRT
jgi:hypothetical protein